MNTEAKTDTKKDAPKLDAPLKKKKEIIDFLNAPDTIKKFEQVLSGHIKPEKMLRLCFSALRKTPRLLECDPSTVFGAMMTAASLDLEPNTVLQQSFLIPYGKNKKTGTDPNTGKAVWEKVYECNFQIGYRGFVDLAYRSPRLVKLEAEAIRAGDVFDHEKGSDSFLKYKKALKERGELLGAFCYFKAQTEGGATTDISTILPLDELHKIRAKSETYRSLLRNVENADAKDKAKAEAALADTPWVMWIDDMAAKSAIKKAIKQFPISNQIAVAAQIDSDSDTGVLDLKAMTDVDFARAVREGEETPRSIEYAPAEEMELIKPTTDKEKQPVSAENKPAAGVNFGEE